jgi:hypothetical protein
VNPNSSYFVPGVGKLNNSSRFNPKLEKEEQFKKMVTKLLYHSYCRTSDEMSKFDLYSFVTPSSWWVVLGINLI